MTDKTSILVQVIAWLHNSLANSQTEQFWTLAKNAILGDILGIDDTAPDWDLTHAEQYPALWFYACLYAGRVFLEDADGAAAADNGYKSEVARVSTAPVIRGTTGQLRRPYGA